MFQFGTSTATSGVSTTGFNPPATTALAYGSPMTSLSSLGTAPFSVASQPQQQQPGFSFGLGGPSVTNSVGGLLQNYGQSSDTIMTPRTTPLVPELLQLVESFKVMLKNQMNTSESILADGYEQDYQQIDQRISATRSTFIKHQLKAGQCSLLAQNLKEESRRDLRSGETIQHLVDSPNAGYTVYGYTVLTNYLTNVTLLCERNLNYYVQQISLYENMIVGRSNRRGISLREILLNLKETDRVIKNLSLQIYQIHQSVQDLKETFVQYRRTRFDDKTNYFDDALTGCYIENKPKAKFDSNYSVKTTTQEGPNMFHTAGSTGAMLEMAKAFACSKFTLHQSHNSTAFPLVTGQQMQRNAANLFSSSQQLNPSQSFFSLATPFKPATNQQPTTGSFFGNTTTSAFQQQSSNATNIGRQQQPLAPIVGVARPFGRSAEDEHLNKRNRTGLSREI